MKKKETEIATNVSSGAEKVEVVEKEIKKTRAKNGGKALSAKGDAALGDSVKTTVKETRLKTTEAEKESEAAKARVARALKKKEEQEKRKAQRAEAKKKRDEKRAEAKKKREEELLALERERAHRKANRNRKKSHEKEKKENRSKGYGGWIAAVVTLGATTLALATTVTVGAIEMNDMKTGMTGAHMGTMYELTGVMEHIDDDLDRARISASPVQQSRILTDLLVQARIAEVDLEKLPVSLESDRNITEFINRTAMECERMLSKLRHGGTLSEEEFATLESLYKTNHSIREELDKLTGEMTDKDLMDYIKDGAGMVSEALGRLENMTLEENRAALESKMGKMKEAGKQRDASASDEKEKGAIDTARAEELCKQYFADYSIGEYQCVGETATRHYSAYNVQGYDENGSMLFAEIDRNSGKLIAFDYYEECSAETFDLDNAEKIAEEFLTSLGYEDMAVARVRESGTTADFTYVYEVDGVAYYPDAVHVKVCRTRGVVSGLDATKYLKNHRGRDEVNAKINLETAREKLSDKLTVEASKLSVVDTARGERAAYEFLCSYNEANYFVYIDADTGEEIAILNVQNVR